MNHRTVEQNSGYWNCDVRSWNSWQSESIFQILTRLHQNVRSCFSLLSMKRFLSLLSQLPSFSPTLPIFDPPDFVTGNTISLISETDSLYHVQVFSSVIFCFSRSFVENSFLKLTAIIWYFQLLISMFSLYSKSSMREVGIEGNWPSLNR
jgi:hypothetical protein